MIVLICGQLFAGSTFSFHDTPERQFGYDAYSAGMGYSGSGDLFRVNSSLVNPALMASTGSVVFSGSASFGNIKYKDSTGNSFDGDGFVIPQFNVIIPVKQQRFGFGVSYWGGGNFEHYSRKSISVGGDDVYYDAINKIESSINTAHLSWALKTSIVNIGLGANYYIGQHIRYYKNDFESTSYIDAVYETAEFMSKPGFTIGLSKKLGNLSMAVAFASETTLEGNSNFNTVFSRDSLKNSEMTLPSHINAGIAWRISPQFKTTADFHYETWSSIDNYDNDTWQIGGGASYDPQWGQNRWYKRIPLRTGAYMRQLPLEMNNSKVYERESPSECLSLSRLPANTYMSPVIFSPVVMPTNTVFRTQECSLRSVQLVSTSLSREYAEPIHGIYHPQTIKVSINVPLDIP